MQQTELLVIDELTMGHRYIYECLDRSLQDVRGSNKLFGGLTILFSGDWKQILLVVKGGSQAQIIDATLINLGAHLNTGIIFKSSCSIIRQHKKKIKLQIISLKLEMKEYH